MEVKVLQDILKVNDSIAIENSKKFASRQIFSINMMSSPGSGKTSILEVTMKHLAGKRKAAVIEGDIRTTVDSERLIKYNIPVVQINTDLFGGTCHLDANMVGKAFDSLPEESIDVLFVENVGNLVCPAGYKLGTDKNVIVLSTTEGEDKPLKYPLIFRVADLLLINKIDLIKHLDFDIKKLDGAVRDINPNLHIIPLSAKTEEGISDWIQWLDHEILNKKR